MKKLLPFLSFFLFLLYNTLSAQNSALIIGDGIRIRTEPSAKGKEMSKVYGFREVQWVETSKKKDDLGSKDPCELYRWQKVKWTGDSTGWVYGKYYFESSSKPVNFSLGTNHYSGLSYENRDLPEWGDDKEGAYGCSGVTTYVMFYSDEKKKYYTVKDGISKSTKYLDIDQYAGATIEKIEISQNNIILYAKYATQEEDGTEVYTIAFTNGQFSVTSYK